MVFKKSTIFLNLARYKIFDFWCNKTTVVRKIHQGNKTIHQGNKPICINRYDMLK